MRSPSSFVPQTRTRSHGSARARMRRCGWAASVVAISLALGGTVDAAECWPASVTGTVVDPFRAPACAWCPGNRGIEYEVAAGTRPRAVAAGIVSFSGVVAGERYVVVDLPNGWKLTYGRLVDSHLHVGDAVIAGSIVGSAAGPFYFGLRVDGAPVDPAPYLGVATGTPRLVPVDGRRARPSPGARLVCPVGVAAPGR
jgi:murein DD-endopeptidase MepM/ murein hydrolase activator NlpD